MARSDIVHGDNVVSKYHVREQQLEDTGTSIFILTIFKMKTRFGKEFDAMIFDLGSHEGMIMM